jgi:hypothetical protein
LISHGKLLLNHSPLAWGILTRSYPIPFVPIGVSNNNERKRTMSWFTKLFGNKETNPVSPAPGAKIPDRIRKEIYAQYTRLFADAFKQVLSDSGKDANQKSKYAEGKAYEQLASAFCMSREDIQELVLSEFRKERETKTSSRKDRDEALGEAVSKGDVEAVRKELASGANPNAETGVLDEPALHRAAKKENASVVSVLLKAGANKEAMDSVGQTPLHIAAQRGNLEVVKTLLAARANPNALMGGRSVTPLLMAVQQGQGEVVKTLLRSGASKTAAGNGISPVKLASDMGKRDMVPILRSAGCE